VYYNNNIVTIFVTVHDNVVLLCSSNVISSNIEVLRKLKSKTENRPAISRDKTFTYLGKMTGRPARAAKATLMCLLMRYVMRTRRYFPTALPRRQLLPLLARCLQHTIKKKSFTLFKRYYGGQTDIVPYAFVFFKI
jgi:hypothetical protein